MNMTDLFLLFVIHKTDIHMPFISQCNTQKKHFEFSRIIFHSDVVNTIEFENYSTILKAMFSYIV